MGERTWSQIVDERARKFELAAMFNGSALCDAPASEWLALLLRDMARLLDAGRRERDARLGSFRLFGLKFTVSRDG